jgi:RND family efflux transporter MFP subunit
LDDVRVVRLATAERRPLERTLSALGSFAAQQEVILSAKVPGRVQALHVDLGSRVHAGDLVAQIERRDYELAVQQAEAALAQARARLGLPLDGPDQAPPLEQLSTVKEAQAVLDEAQHEWKRVQELATAGIASQAELQAAEKTYQVALNRYHVALEDARQRRAALDQRRAELEMARQQLAETTLRAPFAGAIQARHVSLGQYLERGAPIATLVQIDPLRLRLEVPEPQAGRVRLGQPVRFVLTGESRERTATVTRLSPSLDQQTRVLVIEADVPNDGSLHPGSFARARIVVETNALAVVVPAEAIRAFAGLEKVFVEDNGVAVERDITTGDRGDGWVEVTRGLQAGERVVLEPGNLRSGQRLQVGSS